MPEENQVVVKVDNTGNWVSRSIYGLLGSSLVAVLFNFGGVKWFVLTVCSMILGIFGHPAHPPKVLSDIGHKIEDKTKEIGKPSIHLGKSPEEKELERQRKLDKCRSEARLIGLEYDDEWTLERFAVEIPAAKQRAEEAKRREADDKRRNALIDRATKVNFGVNPDLDLKEMEKQVEEAERYVKADADYQLAHRKWDEAMEAYHERLAKGPNSRCPTRGCNREVRFPAARANTKFVCAKCKGIYPVSQAMANWSPPRPPREPQPPKMNEGFLSRFFK